MQRGRLKGEWCGGLYGTVALQNPYLRGYVLYRGGCAFVLRWAMKCSTAFISGYPSCIIVEIRGAIALTYWQILFSVVADPAIVGRFSCEGNDNESNIIDEILNKKQNRRMAVQVMSYFFLHHKNLKKTKDGIWGVTTRTVKSKKVCV